jgi:hypothetical protein
VADNDQHACLVPKKAWNVVTTLSSNDVGLTKTQVVESRTERSRRGRTERFEVAAMARSQEESMAMREG